MEDDAVVQDKVQSILEMGHKLAKEGKAQGEHLNILHELLPFRIDKLPDTSDFRRLQSSVSSSRTQGRSSIR